MRMDIEDLHEDKEKKTEKVAKFPVDEQPTLNEDQLKALEFLIAIADDKIEEIIQKSKRSIDEGQQLNKLANEYRRIVRIVKEMVE